jgi:hypothetical protein
MQSASIISPTNKYLSGLTFWVLCLYLYYNKTKKNTDMKKIGNIDALIEQHEELLNEYISHEMIEGLCDFANYSSKDKATYFNMLRGALFVLIQTTNK